jgi:hypothetical protein
MRRTSAVLRENTRETTRDPERMQCMEVWGGNVRVEKVLCYSDAFTDARGSDGKSLGVDGMLQTVASIQHTDEQALISSLVAAIRALHPENLTQDDGTVVLFRATGTRTSIRDNLLVPFRFFGKVSDASQIVTGQGHSPA